MTDLDFLIVAAGVQAAFLVALIVLIVLTRWFWMRRRARTAGPRAELEQAMEAWARGAGPLVAVLRQFRRLPRGVALDMVLHYATRLSPDAWRRLAPVVANERWARAIRAGAGSRYWWRRVEAGHLLTVAARPQDAPALLRLLGDPRPAVLIAVIGAVEHVREPTLISALLDRLPRLAPTVQAYAAAALQRAPQRIVPVLATYVAGRAGRPGLASYVDLAGRLASPELRTAITDLAGHGDLEVRTAVARALGRYQHDDSVAALQRLAEDRSWQVRAQAVQSLGKLGAPVIPVLQRALRDTAWWVRLRGALALARAGAAGRNALLAAEIGPDAFARDMARLVLGLPPAALAEYHR